MQAKLQVQMNCGECNGQLHYHEDGKFVRCNTVKCSQRHVNYLAPTMELLKEKLDEPAKPVRKKSATKD